MAQKHDYQPSIPNLLKRESQSNDGKWGLVGKFTSKTFSKIIFLFPVSVSLYYICIFLSYELEICLSSLDKIDSLTIKPKICELAFLSPIWHRPTPKGRRH